MPKLKPSTIWPTPDEEATIYQGIAEDPDAFELDEEWFQRARPAVEVEPKSVEPHPRDSDQKCSPRSFVVVEIDSDIAQHFITEGGEWKARFNETLRWSVFGS